MQAHQLGPRILCCQSFSRKKTFTDLLHMSMFASITAKPCNHIYLHTTPPVQLQETLNLQQACPAYVIYHMSREYALNHASIQPVANILDSSAHLYRQLHAANAISRAIRCSQVRPCGLTTHHPLTSNLPSCCASPAVVLLH